MDFGLGLVLSFTNNASSGIQNAVNSLHNLTETASNASSSLSGLAQLGAFSIVADQLGSSFIRAGQGIFNMFGRLLGHVQQTGSEFENFRITLNALYGDVNTAEKQIAKLLDFSVESPFDVNEVKDMLVVLKSQGIEAFEKVSNASKDFKQENLAWIADLMAFKPDIPTQRWRLAITNFLGSGEVRVLRNVLDMGDIEKLLGHKMGETAEARMQDLVQIVNDANLEGLAKKMSLTWTGVQSNIEDAWTKLYKSIADNNVFKKLKESFLSVAGAIKSLDDEEIKALGKTIADGLNIIVKPITIASEKMNTLINSIVRLCQTSPGVVKLGMVLTAIGSAMLLLGGITLKFMSSLGMLTIGLTQFGNAFHSIGDLIKTNALNMLGALLPLTAAIGLLYLSWKNDFGGIRTLFNNFVTDLMGSFSIASQALSMNAGDMMVTVQGLQNTGDFWSNISIGFIKISTLWKSLCDAWNDYTISEELFVKCKELGVLPLLEAILDLKWRVEHFVKGFKKGFDDVITSVIKFAESLTKNLKGTIFDTLIEKAEKFLRLLTNNDPEAWTRLGEIVGNLAGKFLIAGIAMKVLNGAIGKLAGLVTIFSKVKNAITGILHSINLTGIAHRIGQSLAKLFPNIMNLIRTGLQSIFSSNLGILDNLRVVFVVVKQYIINAITGLAPIIGVSLNAIVAMITVIFASVVTYAVTHWEEFKEKILGIWNTIKEEADAIWTSLKEGLTSIWDNLKTAIDPLIEKFDKFKEKLSETGSWISDTPVFQLLVGLLSSIGDIITSTVVPAIQGIIHIFSTVFQAIWNVIVTIFNAIVNVISSLLGSALDVVSGILDVIKGIFTLDLDLILTGVQTIFGGVFDFISTTLGNILSVVGSILDGVLNVFISIWEAIFNTVKGFADSILDTVSKLLKGISGKASKICDIVKHGFDKAITFITSLPSKAVQWGEDFIQGLVNGIKGAAGSIESAVKGVADKIKSFLHFSVPDEGPLTDYESWMPDFMSGLAEGINSGSIMVISSLTNFTGQIKQALNSNIMSSFQAFSRQWIQGTQLIVSSTKKLSTGISSGLKIFTTSIIQVGAKYSGAFKSVLTTTQKVSIGVISQFTNMATLYQKKVMTMVNTTNSGFNKMASLTQTMFTKMVNTVTQSMQRAVNSVQKSVNTMKSTMNFSWSLPPLKVPHIEVSGSFNLKPPSAPKFNVDWYAKGGIFDEPSMIGVGESGKEAVMPLENNTDWIRDLAYKITDHMDILNTPRFTPASNMTTNNSIETSRNKYMTSNVVNNSNTKEGDIDNSITFTEGSIQINCQNASEEEARRMAQVIMQYIKRKKELDDILSYG